MASPAVPPVAPPARRAAALQAEYPQAPEAASSAPLVTHCAPEASTLPLEQQTVSGTETHRVRRLIDHTADEAGVSLWSHPRLLAGAWLALVTVLLITAVFLIRDNKRGWAQRFYTWVFVPKVASALVLGSTMVLASLGRPAKFLENFVVPLHLLASACAAFAFLFFAYVTADDIWIPAMVLLLFIPQVAIFVLGNSEPRASVRFCYVLAYLMIVFVAIIFINFFSVVAAILGGFGGGFVVNGTVIVIFFCFVLVLIITAMIRLSDWISRRVRSRREMEELSNRL